MAIRGLSIDPASRIAYREVVSHPALAEPERAGGTMLMEADGRLIKDQTVPRREISEIGESFLAVRAGPEAARNLLPIPPEAGRMLAALRAVLSGDLDAVAERYAPLLLARMPLWRVRLAVHDDPADLPVVLIGCGARLRGIEIHEPGGVRRLVQFDTAP